MRLILLLMVIGVVVLAGCIGGGSPPPQSSFTQHTCPDGREVWGEDMEIACQTTCGDGRTVIDKNQCYKQFDIDMKVYDPYNDQTWTDAKNQEMAKGGNKPDVFLPHDFSTGYHFTKTPYRLAIFVTTKQPYAEEPITCDGVEYYDGVKNSEYTFRVSSICLYNGYTWCKDKGYSVYPAHGGTGLEFEETRKPQAVRYEISCKGDLSGYTASSMTTLHLTYGS